MRISPYLSNTSQPTLERSAAAGLIRLPRVYRDIACAIQVRSFVATSTWCAAVCVRAGIACVSVGTLGLYRLFFICADGKKTALVQHNSLPHDNVLSQGGGPLAVEGVLLNSDVIYTFPLRPTPSVTCGASSLKREPFGGVFQAFLIGETDFSFPLLSQPSRSAERTIKPVQTASIFHQHK